MAILLALAYILTIQVNNNSSNELKNEHFSKDSSLDTNSKYNLFSEDKRFELPKPKDIPKHNDKEGSIPGNEEDNNHQQLAPEDHNITSNVDKIIDNIAQKIGGALHPNHHHQQNNDEDESHKEHQNPHHILSTQHDLLTHEHEHKSELLSDKHHHIDDEHIDGSDNPFKHNQYSSWNSNDTISVQSNITHDNKCAPLPETSPEAYDTKEYSMI